MEQIESLEDKVHTLLNIRYRGALVIEDPVANWLVVKGYVRFTTDLTRVRYHLTKAGTDLVDVIVGHSIMAMRKDLCPKTTA